MSHLLKSTSSVDALLESGERLTRNCDREGNGAQRYAETVIGAMSVLKEVAAKATTAKDRCNADYDALRLVTTYLDDTVRSVFFFCRKYDWTAGNGKVLEKVFPDAVTSPILKASWRRKAELVTRVHSRLTEVAGETGILADAEAELSTAFGKFTAARETYEKSFLEDNRWKAYEKLGRKEFTDTYNRVYYTACGDIGRTGANRLFPLTQCARRKTVESEETREPNLNNAA